MWLIGTLTLLVLGATVLAVTWLEPDPAGTPTTVARPLTEPGDLRGHRIPMRVWGYDPGTVDVLLAQAAAMLEAERATPSELGEELEDGGGDGAGVLDGGPVADVGEDGDAADRD